MKKGFILFGIILWTIFVNAQTVKNYDKGHVFPYQDLVNHIDTFQYENTTGSDNSFSLRTIVDTVVTSKKPLSTVVINCVRADKKIPITQKTLNDSAIQANYQGQEIPMLLGNQTSVYTNCDGGHYAGYSYFSIRGIDQTRINITLNGVPMNEGEDEGCYTSNYPSFTSAIHSIQIQRGVGTSSNGASSFGGSLNFQSKDGLVKGTDIQLGGGSFNTSRFDISTSTGLSHNLALFANIGGINTDGFRDNSGSKGGSAFISLGYFGKSSITKLNVLTGLSQNKQAWMGSTDSTLAVNYKDNPRGGDNMDNFNQTNVQLQNITMFNTHVKLTTTGFYNYLDGHYNVYNIKDIPVNNYFAYESQYSRWIGGISQIDYTYGDIRVTSSLSASTYSRFHSGYEIYDTTLTEYPYINSGRKNDANGYIKISYDTKKVLYYIDLQERLVDYKYFGDTTVNQTWKFFNPKIGIKVFINKNLDAYWGLAVSHREPTHSIMLNGFLYLSSTNPITIVKPEQVIDNEIGINYNTSKLKVQANVYVMKFTNEMVMVGPNGLNSLPIMMNIPNSVRYGLEVDGSYKLKNFQYNVNSTVSNGEIRINNQTYHYLFNPNFIFKHSIDYNKGKFSVGLNQVFISRVYIDWANQFTLPISSTIGANLGYTFGRYQISIQGNNLTGEKTYSNGSVSNGVRYRIANALQNYFVTFRIHL